MPATSRWQVPIRSWQKDDARNKLTAVSADDLAHKVNDSLERVSATGLSVRLHHGDAESPQAVRDQIAAFGEVLPLLRFPVAGIDKRRQTRRDELDAGCHEY